MTTVITSNLLREYGKPLLPEDAEGLGPVAASATRAYFASHPDFRPTPLVGLPGLATDLGLERLDIKDEGRRLGLGSFKALGGAFAVAEVASRHTGPVPPIFACATDGNHGRSVAEGARRIGARAIIFLHEGVSPEREAAIAGLGAEIRRVPGSYDDSVAEASRQAESAGWTVVSDMSWPGYEDIPRLVMQGYTVLVREALEQLDDPPTHVFIQAGVGGIAAAVAGHCALSLVDEKPTICVVEPDRAACIFESLRQARRLKLAHHRPTLMAMLECLEPSYLAWRILARLADAAMTVTDDAACAAMRRLASPVAGDLPIVAGESGAAGLAGLMCAARHPEMRARLGLTETSRVLLVNTETATDEAIYKRIVGATPEAVLRGDAPIWRIST